MLGGHTDPARIVYKSSLGTTYLRKSYLTYAWCCLRHRCPRIRRVHGYTLSQRGMRWRLCAGWESWRSTADGGSYHGWKHCMLVMNCTRCTRQFYVLAATFHLVPRGAKAHLYPHNEHSLTFNHEIEHPAHEDGRWFHALEKMAGKTKRSSKYPLSHTTCHPLRHTNKT